MFERVLNTPPQRNSIIFKSCTHRLSNTWDKVLKSEPSKICGRHPSKNLKRYGLLEYFVPFADSMLIILEFAFYDCSFKFRATTKIFWGFFAEFLK